MIVNECRGHRDRLRRGHDIGMGFIAENQKISTGKVQLKYRQEHNG